MRVIGLRYNITVHICVFQTMRIGTDLYKELQNIMSAADKLLAMAIARNKVGLADFIIRQIYTSKGFEVFY